VQTSLQRRSVSRWPLLGQIWQWRSTGGFEHLQESGAVRIRACLARIQLLFAIPMRLPLPISAAHPAKQSKKTQSIPKEEQWQARQARFGQVH
jgi:hypothetical protein